VGRVSSSEGEDPDGAYLDLAREIKAEVARVAAEDDAGTAALEQVFSGITDRERRRIAREVFDRLPATEQWEVIERVFDDDELAAALSAFRSDLLAAAQRRAVAAAVAEGTRLDTVRVPAGGRLTLGLYREGAGNCARRVRLESLDEPGAFQVVDDVFNPDGDYFVTGAYDQSTFDRDRLPPHAVVRPGSIVPDGGGERLDPVLHLGGRVDVEVDGDLRVGRLHLGAATLDGVDVFEGAAR
jgi:hypothetical protein